MLCISIDIIKICNLKVISDIPGGLKVRFLKITQLTIDNKKQNFMDTISKLDYYLENT